MDIFIDPNSDVGLANQIYEGIRGGIVEGRLGAGDRLPPSRELAATLKVSRYTVTTAYGRLVAEGYLDGHRGGGTVVSELFVPHRQRPAETATLATTPAPADSRPVIYDLRAGMPDPRLFPADDWKRYVRLAVDQHKVAYDDPAGIVDLRRVLARWITRSRGVDASAGQLIVTSGAQQALYLLSRVCAGAGDVVAIEDPGYAPFRRVIERIGAQVAPIPVDDEGIVVDAIPDTARLVYVTPSHQFPTGVTMSMGRRIALLSLAQRRGMVIVEDDYDSEYRYTDRPLEPLFRLDRNGLVAYVASFSKILSPALRLGFAVVPPALRSAILDLRQLIDWAPPTVDQLTLRGFVADGRLDRHLRRTRRVYQGRHERVSAFLMQLADRGVAQHPASNVGLHVSARLLGRRDEADIVGRLADRGVAIETFGSYPAEASLDADGVVFGFGLIADDKLEQALAVTDDVLTP